MTEYALEWELVSKAFRHRQAVCEVTLRVPRGEICGLLGHNGAGKSTCLGMVLGQVYADSGSVRVLGHDVLTQRAKALEKVGAIFETPVFYNDLSGRRNLDALTCFSGPVDRKRQDEVIELVGLSDRIEDKVGAYSHGMRQRLALAQALLPGPEVLVLDEPTDGLDPEGIHETRELIRQLHRELGLTILFSSHLLHEVEQLCTQVAVLREGELIFDAPLSEADTGQALLALEVRERWEDAAAWLRAQGWVHEEVAGSDDQRWLALAEHAEIATINAGLVAQGFAVQRIGPVKLSLEDFYLHQLQKHAEGSA